MILIGQRKKKSRSGRDVRAVRNEVWKEKTGWILK